MAAHLSLKIAIMWTAEAEAEAGAGRRGGRVLYGDESKRRRRNREIFGPLVEGLDGRILICRPYMALN